MTRSSRHKSKRSAKDAREYSDTGEDVSKGKHRERKEGGSRGYKESGSGSGEKRKLASQSLVVKDSSGHGNSEEYVGSKKRKEKSDRVGGDRWNSSGELLGLESQIKEESSQHDEKVLKAKGSTDLKSKVGSGRHDVEKNEETVGSFIGTEESRSGKAESKRRSEKDRSEKEKLDRDLNRKDDYKDGRGKEKGSERDNTFLDSKQDPDYQVVYSGENKVKKGVESKDWALDDDNRKHGSEKERERRRRKRTDEVDGKDKYQDRIRDSSDINLKSRREQDKDGRDKAERGKDIRSRDKHHGYYDRDPKDREDEKREGTDRELTQKNEEYRDDRTSRDYIGNPNDSKYVRDEIDTLESRHKKSRTDNNNYDSSVMYDDQSSRYKDYKETRSSTDKEDYGDLRPQGAKEHLEPDNKSGGAREDTVSDRERSRSFHTEEPTFGQSRQKRSPSSNAHATRDHYRYSKQSETKYRELLPEERSHNKLTYGKEGNGSGASHSSRATDKSVQTGDNGYVADLTSERHRNTDRRASPVRLTEKSYSPSSSERRHHSRTGDRRSLDYEDAGHRNRGHKDTNYQFYDGKRSQDVKVEASSMDDASQVDGDNLPVSSSLTRFVRMSDNSRSLLPPPSPLKHGVDNSYAVGSFEDDGRGKLNNRPKRLVDSSMGRMRGNAWRGVPNWPSPMANGFMPYPHGPQTVGFHPMMQQFPPQMFGVRPSMDHTGVPYHMPDVDRFSGYGRPFGWPNPGDDTCPSPMQNWDSNNMVPGEVCIQGRPDWDQNKSLMASANREPSVDRYKGSNSGTLESPSSSHRAIAEAGEDFSSQTNHGFKSDLCQSNHQVDRAGHNNQFGSNFSSDMSNAKVSAEIKRNLDSDVHHSCVYLSKIDISAHLAHSDLFDQCVSLIGVKQNASVDTRVSKFSVEENCVVEGGSTTIYTYISRVPIFAGLGDSVLEKAISLYRQQREDIVANSLSFPSNGNQVLPSPEIQGSDPTTTTTTIDGRLSLASPPTESPASNNFEDKAACSISCPKLKSPSPAPYDKLIEDVENNSEAPTSPISTSEYIKKEVSSVLDKVASENTPAENVIVETPDIDLVEGKKPVETEDEQAASKTATGDPTLSSTTNVPFEGHEDILMTELNEFGSVNLRRIHQSPESTH